jgi:hypothetical protein
MPGENLDKKNLADINALDMEGVSDDGLLHRSRSPSDQDRSERYQRPFQASQTAGLLLL